LDSRDVLPHTGLVSPWIAIVVGVAGFASGVLSGMFGVGGAVLTTPSIRFLGATPIESVGSTIPAILPGSMSGAWRYSRAGMVDWRVALPAGLFGSGFAVAGAEMSDHVNGHILMLITAAMLLWSGLATIRKRRAADLAAADPLPVPVGGPADAEGEVIAIHAALTPAVGAVGAGESESKRPIVVVAGIAAAAGLLAGLLGVGGGVLLVPAFTGILRIPPKRAVASSLVAVAMFSIPAMVTHTLLGHINWAYALPLVAGVVPGAQVGAKFTLQRTEAQLRFLMGLFFVILAIVYGTRELLAL